MTHTNGTSHYAQLDARVAELERALSLLTRRWQRELIPRLVRIEHEVDTILNYLDAGARQPDDGAAPPR